MREQTQEQNREGTTLEQAQAATIASMGRIMAERAEAIATLRAEQTRLREALEAVKVYWTRYGFSGWKGDDDFDRLSNQIDAALSSTPTPEHSK